MLKQVLQLHVQFFFLWNTQNLYYFVKSLIRGIPSTKKLQAIKQICSFIVDIAIVALLLLFKFSVSESKELGGWRQLSAGREARDVCCSQEQSCTYHQTGDLCSSFRFWWWLKSCMILKGVVRILYGILEYKP